MKALGLTEETANEMTGVLKETYKVNKETISILDRLPLIIKQSAKRQLLYHYHRYVFSYFKFDWKYPMNRLRYWITPINIVNDRMQAKLDEMEAKIKEIDLI